MDLKNLFQKKYTHIELMSHLFDVENDNAELWIFALSIYQQCEQITIIHIFQKSKKLNSQKNIYHWYCEKLFQNQKLEEVCKTLGG